VLGPTGRNFAAGMSGGIAYVFDEDGEFSSRVNMEMVDLGPLDAEDECFVRDRIEAHLKETDSAVAARLISNWTELASRFVKVMPTDYRRVLDAARKAEERGESVIDAIMESAHG